ncbi:hypothetical protein VPH35_001511 [Triticum aestivum]
MLACSAAPPSALLPHLWPAARASRAVSSSPSAAVAPFGTVSIVSIEFGSACSQFAAHLPLAPLPAAACPRWPSRLRHCAPLHIQWAGRPPPAAPPRPSCCRPLVRPPAAAGGQLHPARAATRPTPSLVRRGSAPRRLPPTTTPRGLRLPAAPFPARSQRRQLHPRQLAPGPRRVTATRSRVLRTGRLRDPAPLSASHARGPDHTAHPSRIPQCLVLPALLPGRVATSPPPAGPGRSCPGPRASRVRRPTFSHSDHAAASHTTPAVAPRRLPVSTRPRASASDSARGRLRLRAPCRLPCRASGRPGRAPPLPAPGSGAVSGCATRAPAGSRSSRLL